MGRNNQKDKRANNNPELEIQKESNGITDISVLPEQVEVIGIKFKETGKTYFFDPAGFQFKAGGCAIVETARGNEFGYVVTDNKFVSRREIVPPFRPVVREATEEDIRIHDENVADEKKAFEMCLKRIPEHNLDMKLIDAEYTFDRSKLMFYFTADGRVDFRELVKDLASIFRTRIEMRQIGIRDEAKLLGGLGVCGRPFCCSSFLSDFVQVSIKMAKEQNLSLNSAKISGTCGRLMCCLRYEHETYEEEIRLTPPVDSKVRTADGVGYVTEISPLAGMVKVAIEVRDKDKVETVIRAFHRDDVKVLQTPGKNKNQSENSEKEK